MVASSPSSASPPSSSNLLENRADFKLHTARKHLDNLKRLERDYGSLVASSIRIDAEIELDEFFYQLVGVKDALLQEINRDFKLGIKPRNVTIGCVYAELEKKKGLGKSIANNIMEDISKMKYNALKRNQHPLWVVSELNNHSKHRAMIKKQIVSVDGNISNVSLFYPHTNRKMKKPIIEYLDDSYKMIEGLQKRVRKRIAKHYI